MKTKLFETLEKIKPIESSFVNTHSEEDKYLRTIQLIFRFSELNKQDDIYKNLIEIVNNFNGNEKWIMTSIEETENFIITPSYFYDNQIFARDTSKIADSGYKKVIDKAIDDIPEIIKEINFKFNL